MNYKQAINASQIWAARGYDHDNVCVVAVCVYGGKTLWLTGFGGNWSKKWEPVEDPEDEDQTRENFEKLEALRFVPTGPKPDEQVAAELLDILGDGTADAPVSDEMQEALAEIADEYEWADELRDDYFEPMGESYD